MFNTNLATWLEQEKQDVFSKLSVYKNHEEGVSAKTADF